jgi:hypothetical protein
MSGDIATLTTSSAEMKVNAQSLASTMPVTVNDADQNSKLNAETAQIHISRDVKA